MGGVRVLVVDDFAEWRQFVRGIIGDVAGLHIIGEASDGAEAVAKARVLEPDLVLLDIGLPSLNGIEVARQIRQFSPRCAILFLTEHQSNDVIEECYRAGASGYIFKSSAANELLLAINAALNRNSS